MNRGLNWVVLGETLSVCGQNIESLSFDIVEAKLDKPWSGTRIGSLQALISLKHLRVPSDMLIGSYLSTDTVKGFENLLPVSLESLHLDAVARGHIDKAWFQKRTHHIHVLLTNRRFTTLREMRIDYFPGSYPKQECEKLGWMVDQVGDTVILNRKGRDNVSS
jgi:hypothetical protein